jgi:two-component SAPR family response regulator
MTKPGDSQTTKSEIDHILEIEKVKKEADRLMMNKLAEIEELKNKIADLEESVESKDYFKDPDYKFLVAENHRLEQQYLEVMADNKKLAQQVEDKMDQLRKSGAI